MPKRSYLRHPSNSSVVIPFFYGASTISRALRSIEQQTQLLAQVLVVDDGSSDDEFARLIRVSKEFSKLNIEFYRLGKNLGQSAARNYGASKAFGDRLFFLDQDDYWLPNHVETLSALLDQEKDLVVASTYRSMRVGHCQVYVDISSKNAGYFQLNGAFPNDRNLWSVSSALGVRRSSFEELAGFRDDLRGMEDEYLLRLASIRGKRIAFSPVFSCVWVENGASSSTSDSMIQSRTAFLNTTIELALQRKHSKERASADLKRRFLPHIVLDLVSASRAQWITAIMQKDALLEALRAGGQAAGRSAEFAISLAYAVRHLTCDASRRILRRSIYSIARVGFLASALREKRLFLEDDLP